MSFANSILKPSAGITKAYTQWVPGGLFLPTKVGFVMVAEGFSPTEGGCNQLIIKSPKGASMSCQTAAAAADRDVVCRR